MTFKDVGSNARSMVAGGAAAAARTAGNCTHMAKHAVGLADVGVQRLQQSIVSLTAASAATSAAASADAPIRSCALGLTGRTPESAGTPFAISANARTKLRRRAMSRCMACKVGDQPLVAKGGVITPW